MAWRWPGTVLLEAQRHFHRIKGYRQIATLIQALSKALLRKAATGGLGLLNDSARANKLQTLPAYKTISLDINSIVDSDRIILVI